jgi:hypothetical protein
VLDSVNGTKRTSMSAVSVSAIGGKADTRRSGSALCLYEYTAVETAGL